jgi:site-specific DNA-methyltransferase (adenine-specific)
MTDPTNHLYYGDNLEVLRRHIPDESVDLVYLDPPFNSNADYNVLFAEEDGSRAAAQIEAFGDTWRWDQAAAAAFQDTVEQGGDVAKAMVAFQTLLGDSNMLAYLAMMAPRLVELRRVLKSTGSIWLHCDPTASHYLKLLMDAVFGPENFRNEVTWQRTAVKGDARRKLGAVHDSILTYGKGKETFCVIPRLDPDDEYMARFNKNDGDGRGPYHSAPLDSPSPRPNLTYEYKGFSPPAKGWRVDREEMERLDQDGRLIFPLKPTGRIRRKLFLADAPGAPAGDVWTDIPPLQASSAERLGYPTQKPVALLERIIESGCPEHGVVLDPFCGCGTTIAAAERMGRSWTGIDVTYLAVALMKSRLKELGGAAYEVIGEPTSAEDAGQLAKDDPYQFQWWALGLIGARPVDEKKGADKGIDGRLYFFDDGGSKAKQLIVSVKAGKVQVSHVRDLVGVLQREDAQIGALISLNEPTGPMRKEAASAGMYKSPLTGTSHPRVQLITVAELLDGRTLDLPAIAPQQSMTAKPVTAPAKAKPDQLTLGSD